MHILCTICSDLINQADNIYVTKCGHIFHYHCLKQWIERSKTCPQCRNKVTDKCMFRLYPTISNENAVEDITTIQSRLDDTQLMLREQKNAFREQSEKLEAAQLEIKKNFGVLKATEKKLESRDAAVAALKEQLHYVKIQNRETQKLKEENETMKKNLQTLNGLQKVLNATSDEVEQMLEGYSDLRTIATFATALKRALCESESKKNESRDRMQELKRQITTEKNNNAEMQAKLMHLEDNLNTIRRKYKCLKNKRKAPDVLEQSAEESPQAKQRKSEPELNTSSYVDDFSSPVLAKKSLNDAIRISDSTETSFNTMVNQIEQADSPYLSLRHSGLALAALQRRPAHALPDALLKPSEFAVLNSAKNTFLKKNEPKLKHSIFEPKESLPLSLKEDACLSEMNISYDGLGGHSKLDVFPVPNNRPALKSCIPKLSSKHRLKRPTPSGSQDIGKIMAKLHDKSK